MRADRNPAAGVGSSPLRMASTAAPDRAPDRAAGAAGSEPPEVSVVIPCLNEADTLAVCLGKARRALDACGGSGEVVVAGNGSSHGPPRHAGHPRRLVAPS